MGQGDGRGHQLGRFVASKAEHHALVAGAGFAAVLIGAVHAHGDVGALLVDIGEDGAGVGVKAIGRVGIADVGNDLSGHGGDVHMALIGHFAHDQRHAGGGDALAGHAGHGVLGQNCVKNAVGDLVAHLVGMPLGDGFGGENTLCHGCFVPFV